MLRVETGTVRSGPGRVARVGDGWDFSGRFTSEELPSFWFSLKIGFGYTITLTLP